MNDIKLNRASMRSVINQITRLCEDNKTYRVSIKQWRESRTVSQNRLYWLWMNDVCRQKVVNGRKYTPEVWHELFKNMYCPRRVVDMPYGEPIYTTSTTELDTGEMHFYMNQVEVWAMNEMIKLTMTGDSEYERIRDKQLE